MDQSLESIIILRPYVSCIPCHGNESCSTAYSSSVTMFSCVRSRSSRAELLRRSKSSDFTQNTQRNINHDWYMFTCIALSHESFTFPANPFCTDSVSICKRADHAYFIHVKATVPLPFVHTPPNIPCKTCYHTVLFSYLDLIVLVRCWLFVSRPPCVCFTLAAFPDEPCLYWLSSWDREAGETWPHFLHLCFFSP